MIKNHKLYETLGFTFPNVSSEPSAEEVTILFDGVDITLNQAGVAAYRNEHAKGDAFRKALLLGVNALDLTAHDDGLFPLPYASVPFERDKAITVYLEDHHESMLAHMHGSRAIELCLTKPIAETVTRNDASWDM